jgi:hypothetical protein
MHKQFSPPPPSMRVTVAAAKVYKTDTEDLAFLSCEEYQAYKLIHS